MLRALLMATALSLPAAAQRVTEPGSGLSVDPPAGYAAALAEARPPNAAAISLRRPEDTDTGCQIVFRPQRENAAFSQSVINQAVLGLTWGEEAARNLSAVYDIQQQDSFRHAGVEVIVLEGMVRMVPGVPERGREIRTIFFIFETPRGRTSVICVGEVGDFAVRRAEFVSVARAIDPPALLITPGPPPPRAVKP